MFRTTILQEKRDAINLFSNCQVASVGTTVSLPSNWAVGEEDLLGWNADSTNCSLKRSVWCVGLYEVFLPLILRAYDG